MGWQSKHDTLFIGGEWVSPAGGGRIDVISPFTEEVVASVPEPSIEDADRAVKAARTAFDSGPWPRLPLEDRIAVIRRVAELMEESESLIAETVSAEMGCPISLSQVMQSRNPRILVESYLESANEVAWSTVRYSFGAQALVTREPVGVVAAITPWNAPLLSLLIKIIPALLAGCTVVAKPSPEAPLSSYLLAEFFERAGMPPGVINILSAGREVGEHLVTHPDVDKVSFTGSTAAGRRIASLCGQDLRRVTLELGGKSAAVILEDADLDLVVNNVRALSLRNTGQVCSNKTRLVVPRSREGEIRERLAAMFSSLRVGDPLDPQTELGPLVTSAQRERVEGYIAIGREEGAKVLVGGGRPSGLDRGWFVEPTLFTDVTPGMRIAQEEIFGPVLAMMTYDTEAEAVTLANSTRYGLNGSVFSADEERALAVARGIRTGVVEVNGQPVGWKAPVGGFRDSGIGREAGIEGFEAYVELKSYGISAGLAEKFSQSA